MVNPILEWSFNEASGAVVDNSGNSRGFSLTGNSARTAAGGGYTFAGAAPNSKGLITTGTDIQAGPAITGLNTTSRTIMAWVKTSASDPSWFLEYHRAGVDDTGVWGFLLLGGTFRFRAKNSSGTAFERNLTLDAANFHHLAATHDGTNLKVYRDGVQVGADVSMAFAVWGADDVRVFDGCNGVNISHVRVFDVALTSTEINTWMNTPTPTATATDLVIADATQATSTDAITLTQTHILAVADATSNTSTDPITLTQIISLIVQKAMQATSTDPVNLSQIHQITIFDAFQATRAKNVTLVGPGFGGFMSVSDIQLQKLQVATGKIGTIADLEFAYYSGLSGLVPVAQFSVTDHQRKYWETQTGLTGRSMADLEKAFYDGLLIAAGSLADREFTYWTGL